MIIVLLSGWLGSGKDTVGDYLCNLNDKPFTRVAFADALKDEVSRIHKIDRALMDTQEGKKSAFCNKRSVRDVLIEHGLNVRKVDPDYWIKLSIEKIKALESQGCEHLCYH